MPKVPNSIRQFAFIAFGMSAGASTSAALDAVSLVAHPGASFWHLLWFFGCAGLSIYLVVATFQWFRWSIWYRLDCSGFHHNEKGNFETAEQRYRLSLRLHPTGPDSYYNLGTALGNQEDYPAAICFFSEAVELDPFNSDYYRARSKAYALSGQIELAERDTGEAERLETKH